MTIHGLFKMLKDRFGYVPKDISISDMKGKKVAIDVSIFAYKANYYTHTKYPIIRFFIIMLKKLIDNDIFPIFVFDGKPPTLKKDTNTKRSDIRAGYKKKIVEYTDKIKVSNDPLEQVFMEAEIKKLQKNLDIKPEDEMMKKLFKIIELMGFLSITVDDHDAENLCAYMQKNGYVDYVIGTDGDTLTNGCKYFISDYSNSKESYKMYELDEIIKSLNFTSIKQFIDLCILLGTDYNKREKGYGPVKAYKTIQNGIMVDTIVKNYKQVYDEFTFDYTNYLVKYEILKKVESKKLIDICKQNIKISELEKIEEYQEYAKLYL